MHLNDWQRRFEEYLLGDDVRACGELLQQCTDGKSLSGEAGLSIYHHAYRARLLETLRGDYAALHALLGDQEFEALVLAYLRVHPPRHFSLRWLGQDLADFIEQHLIEGQAAPLAELARLEWRFTLAFDSAEAQPLSLATVSALSAGQWLTLRVRAHPSLQRLSCHFNTVTVWRQLKQQAEFPGSEALAQEQVCLIWRQDLVCRYRSLSMDEATALCLMLNGANFSEMCASLQASSEQASLLAATWLKQWLHDGLLVNAKSS